MSSGLRYWFVLGRGLVRRATWVRWVVVGMEGWGVIDAVFFFFKLPYHSHSHSHCDCHSHSRHSHVHVRNTALEFICITHSTAWALKARDSV